MRDKKSENKTDEKDNDKPKGITGDYTRYIKYLENHKWYKESITINELNTRLATINNINKININPNEAIFLDVQCPPGMLICIPGIENFPENYHIEKIPSFEIKLGNSNGEEINPDTKIKILKKKIVNKDEELCELKYENISMTNFSDSPNLFKNYNELFRFKNGIELKGEDHLKLLVVNPNIDINYIKFNLGLDLLTRTD